MNNGDDIVIKINPIGPDKLTAYGVGNHLVLIANDEKHVMTVKMTEEFERLVTAQLTSKEYKNILYAYNKFEDTVFPEILTNDFQIFLFGEYEEIKYKNYLHLMVDEYEKHIDEVKLLTSRMTNAIGIGITFPNHRELCNCLYCSMSEETVKEIDEEENLLKCMDIIRDKSINIDYTVDKIYGIPVYFNTMLYYSERVRLFDFIKKAFKMKSNK